MRGLEQDTKRSVFALALCLLAATGLSASVPMHPRIERLSVDDGLPHGTVYSITQDPIGFLWFGTEDGLARYDGYEFAVFSHKPEDDGTLSTNQASHAFTDSRGQLLIGTWGGGLDRLDLETGRFEHHRPDPTRPGALADGHIQCLFEDRMGVLWLGTHDGGLHRFDQETGTFEIFRHDPADPTSLSHDRIWSISQDQQGFLWLGTSDGLDRFDPATGRTERFPASPDAGDAPLHPEVRAVLVDDAGAIWVGTRAGLSRIDPESMEFEHFLADAGDPRSLGDDTVNVIFEDRLHRVWIGTMYGGLGVWDEESHGFVVFRHDQRTPHSLAYDDVRAIFEDRSGLIWIGTRGEGANKLDPQTPFSGQHFQTGGDSEGLSHERVWSVLEDQQKRLWVGTQAGLDWIAPDRQRIHHITYDPARTEGLGRGDVKVLHRDRDDHLWAATNAAGLHRTERPLGAILSLGDLDFLRIPPASVGGGVVRAIVESPTRTLWIATTTGVHQLDLDSLAVTTHLRHDPGRGGSLSEDRVQALLLDRRGLLWIATQSSGLDRLDPATGEMDRFQNEPTNPRSLSRNDLLSLHEDKSGFLWVGTLGGGLNRLDPGSGEVIRYTSQDGLPSSVIQAIVEDDHENLWLSTNRGLARLDTTTGSIQSFDTSDGLHGATFNLGASFVTPAGEIFFGANHGLESFWPAEVDRSPPPPLVAITAFELFGQEMSFEQPIWRLDEIRLSETDNYFAIEFAALDFRNPESNRFRYRLEGFDRHWVDSGNRRVAHYTNLDGGRYVFQVQASNQSGVWNETSAELAIEIVPTLWNNTWFRSAIALLLIGLVSAGVTLRLRSAEANRAHLEALVDERTLELQHANRRLEEVSVTDPLTQLRNRRYLYQVLESDVARCLREHQRWLREGPIQHPPGIDLLFVLLDLDHFKAVNDDHGHRIGDQVLVELAELLRNTCREADVVVRWGGEEFLVVCRFEDRRSGPVFAERIRVAVEEHVFEIAESQPIRMTCSLGLAAFPLIPERPEAVSWEQVLDLADRGLYAAKGSGRNTWVEVQLAAGAQPERVLERLHTTEELEPTAVSELVFRARS